MKAKHEHRVPLSSQALALLNNLPAKDAWLFPSLHQGRHISNMAMLKLMRDIGVASFPRTQYEDSHDPTL